MMIHTLSQPYTKDRGFTGIRTFIGALSILALVLLDASSSADPPALPHGWRIPSSAETNDDWRNQDSNRYLVVKADFNGDGIPDQARLLIHDGNSQVALFAFVSQKDRSFKTYSLDEKNAAYLKVLGITKVPPGRYTTACGKGYAECRGGEQPEVVLGHHAIDYFKVEGPHSYFYWDSTAIVFKVVGISD